MRRLGVLACAVLVLWGQPAAAWDPLARELEAADPRPTLAPARVPSDLYLVTDVYEGDVVSTHGATTVYTTTTVRQTPGTYARIVDVVGTGEPSRYDGASLNRRARLPDGRLVAGTYYEDFVLTTTGFVSVNIVFFQDDSVTVPPPPSPPSATPPPRGDPTRAPAPTAGPRTPAPSQRPPPSASAGIALGPTAPVLAAIEVLRGRTVALWPRALIGGVPVTVRSWRLVSVDAGTVSARDGAGDQPCRVVWLVLPPAGRDVVLRFEVTTAAAPDRVLGASLRVAVRSPALVQ